MLLIKKEMMDSILFTFHTFMNNILAFSKPQVSNFMKNRGGNFNNLRRLSSAGPRNWAFPQNRAVFPRPAQLRLWANLPTCFSWFITDFKASHSLAHRPSQLGCQLTCGLTLGPRQFNPNTINTEFDLHEQSFWIIVLYIHIYIIK